MPGDSRKAAGGGNSDHFNHLSHFFEGLAAQGYDTGERALLKFPRTLLAVYFYGLKMEGIRLMQAALDFDMRATLPGMWAPATGISYWQPIGKGGKKWQFLAIIGKSEITVDGASLIS